MIPYSLISFVVVRSSENKSVYPTIIRTDSPFIKLPQPLNYNPLVKLIAVDNKFSVNQSDRCLLIWRSLNLCNTLLLCWLINIRDSELSRVLQSVIGPGQYDLNSATFFETKLDMYRDRQK